MAFFFTSSSAVYLKLSNKWNNAAFFINVRSNLDNFVYSVAINKPYSIVNKINNCNSKYDGNLAEIVVVNDTQPSLIDNGDVPVMSSHTVDVFCPEMLHKSRRVEVCAVYGIDRLTSDQFGRGNVRVMAL